MEEMCSKTLSFIDNLGIDKDKISFVCFSISGRIDTNAGISHSAFNFEGDDTPLAETLSEKTGLRVIIENNTRAMTFGELSLYNKDSLKNFIRPSAPAAAAVLPSEERFITDAPDLPESSDT